MSIWNPSWSKRVLTSAIFASLLARADVQDATAPEPPRPAQP